MATNYLQFHLPRDPSRPKKKKPKKKPIVPAARIVPAAQQKEMRVAAMQTHPAPIVPAAARPITPAPVNVSPLRAPGQPERQLPPSNQSLAVQVAKLPTPGDEGRAAVDTQDALGEMTRYSPRVKGGLTPAADVGKPAVVEVPARRRITPAVPSAAPAGVPGWEAAAGPAATDVRPVTPEWRTIPKQAAGLYAREAGSQAQLSAVVPQPAPIQPAPMPEGPDKWLRDTPRVLREEQQRKLIAAAAPGKRADARAAKMDARYEKSQADAVTSKELTATKYEKSQADAKTARELTAAKHKQSRGDEAAGLAVGSAKQDVAAAQSDFDSTKKTYEDLQKRQDPNRANELDAAKEAYLDAAGLLDKARGGAKKARGARSKRYAPITPAPGKGGAVTGPPAAPADRAARQVRGTLGRPRSEARSTQKAMEVVGSKTVSDMGEFLSKTMFGQRAKPSGEKVLGGATSPGWDVAPIIQGRDVSARDQSGVLAPSHGALTLEGIETAFQRMLHKFPQSGKASKAEMRTAAAAELVSWIGTNEHLYPEATKEWRTKNKELWKKHAPAATADTITPSRPPRGRGQPVPPKVARLYLEQQRQRAQAAGRTLTQEEERDGAMRAARVNGWEVPR